MIRFNIRCFYVWVVKIGILSLGCRSTFPYEIISEMRATCVSHLILVGFIVTLIQRDSKRWIQFRTSIFPELYTVCE